MGAKAHIPRGQDQQPPAEVWQHTMRTQVCITDQQLIMLLTVPCTEIEPLWGSYCSDRLHFPGIDLPGQIDGLGFEVETYLVTQCCAGLGVGNEGHQGGGNNPEHQDVRLVLRDLSLFATWKPAVR
jgi:hypothetical protein